MNIEFEDLVELEDSYENRLKTARTALKEAKRFGLQAEILATAVANGIENPSLTVIDCINHAMEEWDV